MEGKVLVTATVAPWSNLAYLSFWVILLMTLTLESCNTFAVIRMVQQDKLIFLERTLHNEHY